MGARLESHIVNGEIALWRGSARTRPIGALEVTPMELVQVLLKYGAPRGGALLDWAQQLEEHHGRA